jgi:hypothetical protein
MGQIHTMLFVAVVPDVGRSGLRITADNHTDRRQRAAVEISSSHFPLTLSIEPGKIVAPLALKIHS